MRMRQLETDRVINVSSNIVIKKNYLLFRQQLRIARIKLYLEIYKNSSKETEK